MDTRQVIMSLPVGWSPTELSFAAVCGRLDGALILVRQFAEKST